MKYGDVKKLLKSLHGRAEERKGQAVMISETELEAVKKVIESIEDKTIEIKNEHIKLDDMKLLINTIIELAEQNKKKVQFSPDQRIALGWYCMFCTIKEA